MPDVLQARRPKQSVGDRVTEDVSIRVTRESKSLWMPKRHASKHKKSLRL